MLTGTFYLYGVVDGENAHYMQLTCSLPVVTVDENNVQGDAAVFRLMEIDGSIQTLVPAWFRLKIMAGDTILETIDQAVVKDELSYMLPTDRYGNADKLLVEAYRDDHETEGSYDEKLAELAVLISRRNPIPFPRSEEWSAGLTYRNGEYLMIDNIVYMWRNPIQGNSSIPPKEDIEQNPQQTSWVAYQNWPLLATQVFLAQWAKLGSFIFNGDIQMSQQGTVNGVPNFDYRADNFIPNYKVNALTGKVEAQDMHIQGGTIGPLEITPYGIGISGDIGSYKGSSMSSSGFIYAGEDIDARIGNAFSAATLYYKRCAGYFETRLPSYLFQTDLAATVFVKTSGGSHIGNYGQVGIAVRTDNGANDVALDLVGRVKIGGKKGYSGGVGVQHVWDPNESRFRKGDIIFEDGICVGYNCHD